MKVMKKDVVMTVGYFSKKVSHDLKKTMNMPLEGVLYSRGVKVRKFELVYNVEVYWKLSSSKMMGDQGWCMEDIRIWSNVITKKCESHKDHDVYNQIEDKDDYVHLVFELVTHKNCWQ